MQTNYFLETFLSAFNLSNVEIEKVKKKSQRIVFEKGETILKQNMLSPYFFIIQSGLVKVVLEGYKGRNFISELLIPEDYLGLSFILEEQEKNYSAISLSKVETICIENRILKNTADTNPIFQKNIIHELVKQNTNFLNKINILGNKNIHGKFANTLLYLFSEKFNNINLFDYISRKELAELSGISIDSVMKLINELKHDKIISVKSKRIVINDFEMVKRLQKIG